MNTEGDGWKFDSGGLNEP